MKVISTHRAESSSKYSSYSHLNTKFTSAVFWSCKGSNLWLLANTAIISHISSCAMPWETDDVCGRGHIDTSISIHHPLFIHGSSIFLPIFNDRFSPAARPWGPQWKGTTGTRNQQPNTHGTTSHRFTMYAMDFPQKLAPLTLQCLYVHICVQSTQGCCYKKQKAATVSKALNS